MVQEGNFVAIHYTGRLETGEIFDSCTGEIPFEFEVGAGTVIEGLDKAVRGMEINEEKHIAIPPEEAYGLYNESMIQAIPIEEVRQYFEPQVGMVIGVQLDEGIQVPATIKEVSETAVVLDFNHQLAGKTLYFDIKIMDINDSPKYSSGCSCKGDDCDTDCSC